MTQTKEILAALKSGRRLTQYQALQEFGCMRLAARIADIRGMGVDVKTDTIVVGNKRKKVAMYYIPPAETNLFGEAI
jgi:hypothetical protein|tara:strand:+ start:1001 stop:1231 length:231 start_codon:yes stop_codon:yes gene_type:complete